ncbi:MAG TPA: hypothetical protein VKY85_11340 [Candidatus Angelobacter sp.]|nr:hypothetical protein [Candidatus Angelobacter sp.]
MFSGTTIEELINSVQRAEQHARQQQEQASALPEVWTQQTQWQEATGVA